MLQEAFTTDFASFDLLRARSVQLHCGGFQFSSRRGLARFRRSSSLNGRFQGGRGRQEEGKGVATSRGGVCDVFSLLSLLNLSGREKEDKERKESVCAVVSRDGARGEERDRGDLPELLPPNGEARRKRKGSVNT